MVGFLRTNFLTVRSVALLLARRRLFSEESRASLVFLQVADGFVDFVDGGLELAAGEFIIAGEIGFELVQVFFKVRDVDVLRAHLCQFLFVFQ